MDGMNIFYEFNGHKRNFYAQNLGCNLDLYNQISSRENLSNDLFKIILNGKSLAQDQTPIESNKNDLYLNISIPLLGGKGGFGSMLRAIGAQIEKTTNRDACRDLTGRRLRDINAEKRIKNWLRRKVELEKEKERQRLEKLERLTQQPNIDFKDDDYLKEKDIIPEKVDDAVNYILKKILSSKKKKKQQHSSSNKSAAAAATLSSTNSEPIATSSKVSESSSSTNADQASSLSTKAVDENNQPCSSSSSDCQANTVDNNLSDSNETPSSVDNLQPCTSNSSDDNLDQQQITEKINNNSNKLNKRKIHDEPIVTSKKKKVQLWLGDDLDSDDDSEDD